MFRRWVCSPSLVKNSFAKKTKEKEPIKERRNPEANGHRVKMTRGGQSLQGKPPRRLDHLWGVVSPRNTTKIGCINVCSLGDKDKDGRAELAARTLSKYKVKICGMSETRCAGFGSVRLDEYTLFYSGSEKGGEHGVGIAVHSSLVNSISAWEPVNDRIM